MMNGRALMAFLVLVATAQTAYGQMSKRNDVVWARDVAGAAITLDGTLSESVWAKAESVKIAYGQLDEMPGSGWKVMNGTGRPTDSANAVVKFLTNKSTNTLYVAVVAKDSSVGGVGWENSDGILAGIYNRREKASSNGLPLHQDIFITWVDSGGVGQGPNLKGGNLPTRGAVRGAYTVQGTANKDTIGAGQRAADQGWIFEMAVSLDSLGYNANSSTTDAVLMTISIWDRDWRTLPGDVATKAWWLNEWGNNGGGVAGRVLVRSDVNVNTAVLPSYNPDFVVPNGANFADPTLDGRLDEPVWKYAPYIDLQFGNDALRSSYSNIGPDRSGQYVPKLSPGLTTPIDPGRCRVKMFFKGDKLYFGADINDQAISSFQADDFIDGLQISLNVPIDTLRDKLAHIMAGKRFGFAVDSLSKGGKSVRWDTTAQMLSSGALQYGLALKSGSTIDNPNDIDVGYTLEVAFDLTKFGYAPGATGKTVALALNYHDLDVTPTDMSSCRVWWYREWPWTSSPAFCLLNNSVLVSVGEQEGQLVANEFQLHGNYPNPFNPSTKIKFSAPTSGVARINVYDVVGRLVGGSEFTVQAGGMQEYTFNASNLASGVYLYRVEFVAQHGGAKQISETKRMVLLK